MDSIIISIPQSKEVNFHKITLLISVKAKIKTQAVPNIWNLK